MQHFKWFGYALCGNTVLKVTGKKSRVQKWHSFNQFYSASGYKCTGHISGWTPCLYTTLTPSRRMWKIPAEFKEDSAFLYVLFLVLVDHSLQLPIVVRIKSFVYWLKV